MSNRISQAEYKAAFSSENKSTNEKMKGALERALENRKFEIELYWKRATYFWTFIGATFAAYGAVQASSIPSRTDLAVFLACLGIVFSFGWFCVNKGSKQWQENWENHVDLLEDDVVGPLYKIVFQRPRQTSRRRRIKLWIAGPAPLSVSKINQLISLFVTVAWIFLLWTALPSFSRSAQIDWEYVGIIAAALLACCGFLTWGKTDFKSRQLFARRRASEISPLDPQKPAGAGEPVIPEKMKQ